MQRSAIIITLAGLTIIWFAIVVYLAGTPAAVPAVLQRIDIGLLPGGDPKGNATFAFFGTSADAAMYEFGSANGSLPNDIRYILGKDVDDTGNASSWMYGIYKDNRTYLLLHDRAGWTAMAWNGTLPAEPINLSALASLGRILADNPGLPAAQGATGRSVEVYGNTYVVSVPGAGGTDVRAFNATTGALIPSHED